MGGAYRWAEGNRVMSAKPQLTYRQEEILRAARGAKTIEVDGKSLRPVETLRDHGLVWFTREHIEGPTAAGHERIIVSITATGRRWFWKKQREETQL
jgi:hypothetical protein